MPTLWAASLRHLVRHPAQLALALVTLSAAVAAIVAVDIATASSRQAFKLSMQAVDGGATEVISAGPRGVSDRLFTRLVTNAPLSAAPQPAYAPVIDGYVTVKGRAMRLLGVDPFAAEKLDGPQARMLARSGGGLPRLAALRRWFLKPGGVVLSARTAEELGLHGNGRFEIDIGGVRHRATLIGRLRARRPGESNLIVTDIARAQQWLGMNGRLSRIDVRLPGAQSGKSALAALKRRLPPGVRLQPVGQSTHESLDMTRAFTTDLDAMSLLALLVSALLVYGAVSFTVVQRRRSIGILRALGATRGEILTLSLAEAAMLGMAGAVLGTALGVAVGRGLVDLVSQTINDLYFVAVVEHTPLPAWVVAEGLGAGLGTALAAALLPALEAAGSAPQLALRHSVLELRAARVARRLAWASVGLAAGAGVLILETHRSVWAGFAALFLLLASAAALTPAVLAALAHLMEGLGARVSAVVRIALAQVGASLSRTGVAVAALGLAIAAMIGVSVMVESFRVSLSHWLAQTLRADIYVTAPGPGVEQPARRIEPAVLHALLGTPGIKGYSESRMVLVHSERGRIPLKALRPAHASDAGIRLTEGDPRRAWSAFHHGALLVSDSLAWRLRLAPGQSLGLLTAEGRRAFPIAGVYRQYGNGRGTALISLATYRRFWHDNAVTAVGLYLEPGVHAAGEITRLRAAENGRQALLIRSNAGIRALSMHIFNRTFLIARILYWLAAGIAAVGLVSALLAWELERAHDLSVLRSLGLTPSGIAALIGAQTAFMGAVALAAAIPAGLAVAAVLTKVVDRRAFGWHIEMHLRAGQLVHALILSLAAALAAGVYPAWRTARASIAAELREE